MDGWVGGGLGGWVVCSASRSAATASPHPPIPCRETYADPGSLHAACLHTSSPHITHLEVKSTSIKILPTQVARMHLFNNHPPTRQPHVEKGTLMRILPTQAARKVLHP